MSDEAKAALEEMIANGLAERSADGRITLTEKGETRAADLIKRQFVEQRTRGGVTKALADIDAGLTALMRTGDEAATKRAAGDVFESITDLLRVATSVTTSQYATIVAAAREVRDAFRPRLS